MVREGLARMCSRGWQIDLDQRGLSPGNGGRQAAGFIDQTPHRIASHRIASERTYRSGDTAAAAAMHGAAAQRSAAAVAVAALVQQQDAIHRHLPRTKRSITHV